MTYAPPSVNEELCAVGCRLDPLAWCPREESPVSEGMQKNVEVLAGPADSRQDGILVSTVSSLSLCWMKRGSYH